MLAILLPRVYPQGFADEIRRLYPGLVTGGEGAPAVSADSNPQETFEVLKWETWQEAKLIQCCRYLRGNKHLQVPQEWLNVFPQPFEVLHRLESRAHG